MPSTRVARSRPERMMPGGVPRYIHLYDDFSTPSQTAARYTCVFTGKYGTRTNNKRVNLGMSADPYGPRGFGVRAESNNQVDYPSYGHLGKKIKFSDLPEPCKRYVVSEYCQLWKLRAPTELPSMVKHYLAAALWASSGDDDIPLDAKYSASDIFYENVESAIGDCRKFLKENAEDVLWALSVSDRGIAGIAHDFWLDRNGHGAGAKDRDYPEDLGAALQKAAEDMGALDCSVGDDGKVYIQ